MGLGGKSCVNIESKNQFQKVHTYALLASDVALSVGGTINTRKASIDLNTALHVRIADSVGRTAAFIATGLVVACGSRTALDVETLVKIDALTARVQFVAVWTNTEALGVAGVDTLLVRWARVVGGTVDRFHEAIIVLAIEVGWAATSVAIETD